MLDPAQIEQRLPLWSALSELWLDTELSGKDLQRIARVLADSGLSIGQLRQVYLFEVAPVVWVNMLSVTGEWSGFDEQWLCARIVHKLNKRPRCTRFWCWFPLTRKVMLYAAEEHWSSLVELVQTIRADDMP